MGKKRGYTNCVGESEPTCRAKIRNVSVHFKNTVETVNAIKGMKVPRALHYLNNVIAHKECVPFRKYTGGIGRCAQAKAFKTTQGRWPQKSAKVLLNLLRNAMSNAEFLGLDYELLEILYIQANPAQLKRRRTFRAHGRITPYMGHHCHLQMILIQRQK